MKLSLLSLFITFALISIVSSNPFVGGNNKSTSTHCASSLQCTQNLNTVLSLRGGEVLEPKTLADVKGILLKASAEGKLVVIDFSASWCGPCKIISPIYHEMSDSGMFPNVVFVKVDVDENPETATEYEVTAMPTFIFVNQGEVVEKLMGANPARLREILEEHS